MSNYTGGVTNRRKRALKRLESQLATDGLPLNIYKKNGNSKDYEFCKARIEKEIETLKSRI